MHELAAHALQLGQRAGTRPLFLDGLLALHGDGGLGRDQLQSSEGLRLRAHLAFPVQHDPAQEVVLRPQRQEHAGLYAGRHGSFASPARQPWVGLRVEDVIGGPAL